MRQAGCRNDEKQGGASPLLLQQGRRRGARRGLEPQRAERSGFLSATRSRLDYWRRKLGKASFIEVIASPPQEPSPEEDGGGIEVMIGEAFVRFPDRPGMARETGPRTGPSSVPTASPRGRSVLLGDRGSEAAAVPGRHRVSNEAAGAQAVRRPSCSRGRAILVAYSCSACCYLPSPAPS